MPLKAKVGDENVENAIWQIPHHGSVFEVKGPYFRPFDAPISVKQRILCPHNHGKSH
jgi:hypothetical protein